MRIIPAASLLKRRGLISASIQSVRFCRPLGSLVPSDSVPLRGYRVPLSFLFACLIDDVMPSSYSVPPLHCPLVMLPRHLSIMWPRFSLLAALSFAPSLVSYRLVSPFAPFLVSSSGAMSDVVLRT